jgi:endogenous inhibitor of DNA gyrase (YacG/DUF329 family)
MSADRPQGKADGSRCPICGAPTLYAVRPFCSPRCADIDLGRWVSGAYVIGGHADADEDGDGAAVPTGPSPPTGADPDDDSR